MNDIALPRVLMSAIPFADLRDLDFVGPLPALVNLSRLRHLMLETNHVFHQLIMFSTNVSVATMTNIV